MGPDILKRETLNTSKYIKWVLIYIKNIYFKKSNKMNLNDSKEPTDSIYLSSVLFRNDSESLFKYSEQ